MPVKAPVIKTAGVVMAQSLKTCVACSFGVGGENRRRFLEAGPPASVS
jgi:hypothetical protein